MNLSMSVSPHQHLTPPQVYIQAFYILGLSDPGPEGGLSAVRTERPRQEAAALSEPGGSQTRSLQGPSGGAQYHGDQTGGERLVILLTSLTETICVGS